MLIFIKGPYLAQIVDGSKTSTIRPWKTCKLLPGGSLTFNGKVRVVLTHVDRRRLGDLTDLDARRDGFVSVAAFRRAFRQHYPTVTADSSVVVLRFASPSHKARAQARSRHGSPT